MMKKTQNKWYAFVPNMLTLFNLVCGIVAIYFAFENKLQIAFILMAIGGLFDFMDGMVARLLKVSGELGKQLDSLADLISFGLLPGVMVFSVQRGLILDTSGFQQVSPIQWILLLSPILIPVFSAVRLAKFNIDTRQTNSFIGLPTPANALFFASLMWTINYSNKFLWAQNPMAIGALILLFSYLLVAEIPLFALKFKSFKLKENLIRFIFLIVSFVFILLLGITGLTLIVPFYILLSVSANFINK